jgi:hypothetical protein
MKGFGAESVVSDRKVGKTVAIAARVISSHDLAKPVPNCERPVTEES